MIAALYYSISDVRLLGLNLGIHSSTLDTIEADYTILLEKDWQGLFTTGWKEEILYHLDRMNTQHGMCLLMQWIASTLTWSWGLDGSSCTIIEHTYTHTFPSVSTLNKTSYCIWLLKEILLLPLEITSAHVVLLWFPCQYPLQRANVSIQFCFVYYGIMAIPSMHVHVDFEP